MTVNTEVTAVVENESEEKREENCTECVFVELGEVSKDTQGFGTQGWDGGIWFRA